MLETIEKRVAELEATFSSNRDQLNALLGRLTEAKELYEAVKKASASQVIDGALSGLEKIKSDEDAAQAAPEGKVNAA